MPMCSAYGSNNGYDSTVTDNNVTFHPFTHFLPIRRCAKNGLERIDGKTSFSTVHSRLSSLHFQSSDFTDIRIIIVILTTDD